MMPGHPVMMSLTDLAVRSQRQGMIDGAKTGIVGLIGALVMMISPSQENSTVVVQDMTGTMIGVVLHETEVLDHEMVVIDGQKVHIMREEEIDHMVVAIEIERRSESCRT